MNPDGPVSGVPLLFAVTIASNGVWGVGEMHADNMRGQSDMVIRGSVQEPPVMKRPGVRVRVDEHLLPAGIVIDMGWTPTDVGGAIMAAYVRSVRRRVRQVWREQPRLVAGLDFGCAVDEADVARVARRQLGAAHVTVEADRFGLTTVDVPIDWAEHVRVDEVADVILGCVDELRPREVEPQLVAAFMAHELVL